MLLPVYLSKQINNKILCKEGNNYKNYFKAIFLDVLK